MMEHKDKLFKKLYVELDDDLILSLGECFSLNYGSSEEILKELTQRFSEIEINDAISHIKKGEKSNYIKKRGASKEVYGSNRKQVEKNVSKFLKRKSNLPKNAVLPEQIREKYSKINKQFINQGKIVSVEEIMDAAGVKYTIIEKNKWYVLDEDVIEISSKKSNSIVKNVDNFFIVRAGSKWKYAYYINDEYHKFLSKSLNDLQRKALNKGLPWDANKIT